MEEKPLLIIPAGKEKKIAGELPHHLEVGPYSILENIINIGLAAGFQVGTSVRKPQELHSHYFSKNDFCKATPQSTLPGSFMYAVVQTLTNLRDKPFEGNPSNQRHIRDYIEKYPELYELPVYTVGADLPFFKTHDLIELQQAYKSQENLDGFMSLTDVSKVRVMNKRLALKLETADSTILNHIKTMNQELRLNNMYVIKPFKFVEKGLFRPITNLYRGRQLSKGNPIAGLQFLFGATEIIGNNLLENKTEAKEVIKTVYAIKQNIKGNYKKRVRFNEFVEDLQVLTGLKLGYDTNGGIGPFLDVDDEPSYKIFKRHYYAINAYIDEHKDNFPIPAKILKFQR